MQKLLFILLPTLFFYSCSKVSNTELMENPPDNKRAAFAPVPTKSEVRQIVYDAIVEQGYSTSQITDEKHLTNDLSLDLQRFLGYISGRINYSIPLSSLNFTTVKNVIDDISDRLLKENEKDYSNTKTIQLSTLGADAHSVLPTSVDIKYSCKVKYLDLDLNVDITGITNIRNKINDANEIKSNNINAAKSNIAGANNVVYDYVITYAPNNATDAFAPNVSWIGYLTVEVFAAHKCENFNNAHKINHVSVRIEQEGDFIMFHPTSFNNGVYLPAMNWNRTTNDHWAIQTPVCDNPGGVNPGTPKPTITAALLQSKLFNVINEEMTDLGRPISNLSMSTRLIEDLQFTKISMETENDFDLDFIEFMLAIENEFGAPVDFPDNVVETFTTVGSIYNYMTTLFTVI